MIYMNHYISKLAISKIRHLHGIDIFLPANRHLILTGKNGSGKTSVLEYLRDFLTQYVTLNDYEIIGDNYSRKVMKKQRNIPNKNIDFCAVFSDHNEILKKSCKGEFIVAYYPAERQYKIANEKHIEKVVFQDKYAIDDNPGKYFVKYLLDMKSSQALYATSGKHERADEISRWFENFDRILKRIFDNQSVHLEFDIETYAFHIMEEGREPFAFDALSSGYAAVLDIVTDLMMRMEHKAKNKYDLEGIVLIDEIEAHLHLSLQKNILPILTELFPNIQFIVSTHSPFILNSISNVVIYDLENKTLVNTEEGLSNIPYEGVVEGYFGASQLSDELKKKFARYQELYGKEKLTDDDVSEIMHLESYLDKIPDYLALDIMADYQKMKLELMDRVG